MSATQASSALRADESAADASTRARILDAAIACFTQFGNDKTTINDVARVAKLSRQTIYRYFSDRGALLEAVQDHEDQRLRDEVEAIAARSASLEEFLTALIVSRSAMIARYRTRQHLLNHDRGLFQSLFLSTDHRIALVRELVAPQLETARRRGELQPGLDLAQAAEWVAITIGSLSTLTDANTFDLDDPAEVARFYTRHLCRGLLAQPTDTRSSPRRRHR
jgi:AcrR family transcriptional regulator